MPSIMDLCAVRKQNAKKALSAVADRALKFFIKTSW